MAKITRATQKQFGSSAGTNELAKFGSLAAGSPARYSGATVTVANIQALTNFLTGWNGAVIGGNSPAIEDMNSLCYLYAYQLGYLLQQGIAEWDAGTTYYIGSLCTYNNVVVQSIADNNTNHTPSVSAPTAFWSPSFLARPNLPTVGQQVSTSSGSFTTSSTSQTAITNLSVTITSTGRPIFVGLIPIATGVQTGIHIAGTTNAGVIYISDGGSQLWEYRVGGITAGSYLPVSTIFTVDTTSTAGSITYTAYASAPSGGGGSIDVTNALLIAYEL